jgi:hypothetical protein
MHLRRVSALYAFIVVLACLPAIPQEAAKAAVGPVTGSYTVLQSVLLGPGSQRVQLRVDLVNHGDDALNLEILGVATALTHAQGVRPSIKSVALAPYGAQSLTLEFVVSRGEYARWQADPRHRLAARVTPSSGEARLSTISLGRTSGGKGE